MSSLTGYELSRSWFDFCFDNPEKINPNHSALLWYISEHCNQLGWKDKFGLPTSMTMEAIGIKNYRTYIKTLNDLIEFGYIKMIEKSKNQYKSNIIAIVKNTKAHTKAHTKAMYNASPKQVPKQVQSIDSVDKLLNNKTINKETINYKQEDDIQIESSDFLFFWNEYDKKVDKDKCKKKWEKLSESDKNKIFEHLPLYKKSTPDKTYRKNPETYLNNKSWNDEIIDNTKKPNFQNGTPKSERVNPFLQEYFDLVNSGKATHEEPNH
jgi:glycerol-3-phosphate cytidylyltransferase-like family protein